MKQSTAQRSAFQLLWDQGGVAIWSHNNHLWISKSFILSFLAQCSLVFHTLEEKKLGTWPK